MASGSKIAKALPQLFVYRLRWTVDKESLRSYFSKFGEVKHAEVLFDEKSGISRMFGKVRMSSNDEVERILEVDQHKIEGGLIRVKIDEPITKMAATVTSSTAKTKSVSDDTLVVDEQTEPVSDTEL